MRKPTPLTPATVAFLRRMVDEHGAYAFSGTGDSSRAVGLKNRGFARGGGNGGRWYASDEGRRHLEELDAAEGAETDGSHA
jgi:hypothetical protein